MLARIVNSVLKTVLKELFLPNQEVLQSNANHVGVKINLMGDDMFGSSHVQFSHLLFRPDLFDILLHPVRLFYGSLGKLSIDGLAELAIGGTLKISIDSLFLLFGIDDCDDVTRVQLIKKLFIELQTNFLQTALVKKVLAKLLSLPLAKALDSKMQKKLVMSVIKQLFQTVKVTIKKIHIRLEVHNKSSAACSAIGITIPSLFIDEYQQKQSSKESQSMSINMKGMQLYGDYDRASYCHDPHGSFTHGWATEVHTALVLPFDIGIILTAAFDSLKGKVTPEISISIPNLRMAFDSRQLEVLRDIIFMIVEGIHHSQILNAVGNLYNHVNPPPSIVTNKKSVRLLPQLRLGVEGRLFPDEIGIPIATTFGLSQFFRKRHPKSHDWASCMWKFALKAVVQDIRKYMPLGKWKELIQLVWARKEYVFIYTKLLRHFASKKSSNKLLISTEDLVQLYEYEIKLPSSVILRFRFTAMTAFNAQLLCQKVKTKKYAKKNLSWREVVHIVTMLTEEQLGFIIDLPSNEIKIEDKMSSVSENEPSIENGEWNDEQFSNVENEFFETPEKINNIEATNNNNQEKSLNLSVTPSPESTAPEVILTGKPTQQDQSKDPMETMKHKAKSFFQKGIPLANLKQSMQQTTASLKDSMSQTKSVLLSKSSSINTAATTPNKVGTTSDMSDSLNTSSHLKKKGFLNNFLGEHELNSRDGRIGDVGRFNTLFSQVLNFGDDDTNSIDSESEFEVLTDSFKDRSSTVIDLEYSVLLSAVRFVLERDQLPISVILSHVAINVDKVDLSYRLPLENLTRQTVLSLLVDKIDFSMELFVSADDREVKSKRLLSGIFFMMKLLVQSLSLVCHKQKQIQPQSPSPDKVDRLVSASTDESESINDIANNIPQAKDIVLFQSQGQPFIHAGICYDIPVYDGTSDKASAIDIQTSLSEITLSLNREAFAVLVDPKVKLQFVHTLYALSDIHSAASLFIDSCLLIDHEVRLPYVLMSKQKMKTFDSQRKDISNYLNTKLWFNILSEFLPKGSLSFHLRLSKIDCSILSAATLREFSLIYQKSIYDKAFQTSSSCLDSSKTASFLQFLKGALKVRKGKARRSSIKYTVGQDTLSSDDNSVKISVDPFNFEFVKAVEPLPLITVKVLGISISIPIEHDTLTRVGAMGLASIIPIYIPPPVEKKTDPLLVDKDEIGKTPSGEVCLAIEKESFLKNSHIEYPTPESIDTIQVVTTKTKVEPIDLSRISPVVSCQGKLAASTESKAVLHSWYPCNHTSFHVRIGPNYKKNKQKSPSASPLYVPFAVDSYKMSAERPLGVQLDVNKLPKLVAEDDTLPSYILVHIMLPTSSTDDVWHLIAYFRISDNSMKHLKKKTPAMNLLSQFVTKATTHSEWSERFKIILNCVNPKEARLGFVMKQMNMKPALAKNCTVVRDGNYMEVILPKSSLQQIVSKVPVMNLQLGFVIEGREDDELPETLLGLIGINKPNEALATQFTC